jgi:hypothetical protein
VTEQRKYIKNIFENSLFLTVLSVLVGVVFRALAMKFGGGNSQVSFLIGVAGVILTLQIGSLYRYREISDQVVALKDGLGDHTGKLEQHHKLLGESIAFLEPAISNDNLLAIMSKIAISYREVQLLKQVYPCCKDFFAWKEDSLFQFLIPRLQQLARGEIVIDNSSKELTTNKDFLTRLPVREVRAVCYQEGDFYDRPEGKAFLRAHTVMMKENDIKVSRIFILQEDEVSSQRRVIEEQVRIEIDVGIITSDKLKDGECEDFVIYDNEYVRFAKVYEHIGTNTLKHATLIVNTDKVKEFIERWESLSARSTDATEFYTELDKKSGAD